MSTAGSHFRTTELGSVPGARGRFLNATVKSPALASRVDASIYVPDQVKPGKVAPVVILLHGVYGSHWVWSGLGKADTTLQALIDGGEMEPMILAMPSDGLWGDGSAYLKHNGKDFERWIVEEVPTLVSEVTGNPADAPLFLAGLSMGGYGAMRIGATHPERFTAFAGHSSITQLKEMEQFVEEAVETYGQRNADDVSVITAMLQNKDRLPPFQFDCGVDDSLIEGNRMLFKQLSDAGIDCSYREYPGGHEWPYWIEHVRETFLFFNTVHEQTRRTGNW